MSFHLKSVLGANAEVKTLNTRVQIECKNLDEVKTKEKTQSDEEVRTDDITLRRTYGETQTAVMRVSEKLRKSSLKDANLRSDGQFVA